jgi:hypothetical protein
MRLFRVLLRVDCHLHMYSQWVCNRTIQLWLFSALDRNSTAPAPRINPCSPSRPPSTDTLPDARSSRYHPAINIRWCLISKHAWTNVCRYIQVLPVLQRDPMCQSCPKKQSLMRVEGARWSLQVPSISLRSPTSNLWWSSQFWFPALILFHQNRTFPHLCHQHGRGDLHPPSARRAHVRLALFHRTHTCATSTSLFSTTVPDTSCPFHTHPQMIWTVHKTSSDELGTRNTSPHTIQRLK